MVGEGDTVWQEERSKRPCQSGYSDAQISILDRSRSETCDNLGHNLNCDMNNVTAVMIITRVYPPISGFNK
ncbi:hypothetical protein M404DRAFT_23218 [Pisolithus tinctorius Marx 270]|uniref:Uncharacterized protein n=1 Tax=Pisolithus tinctorius Marx 270 TaxID=870435 RepID=A0A0C3JFV0_PISTI|nr:hypothetical protein M404DRAFT_23218 [Pisolithus tinctorius Marx 270]